MTPQTPEQIAGKDRWEVGQHPAIANGWIVRPVLFGSRVRVLPECEGGAILIKSEADARLIAAAPDLLAVAQRILDRGYVCPSIEEEADDHAMLRAAITKATPEDRS